MHIWDFFCNFARKLLAVEKGIETHQSIRGWTSKGRCAVRERDSMADYGSNVPTVW